MPAQKREARPHILVAGIHVLIHTLRNEDVDGRVKPGHDEGTVG
jgi:hypothetical protein